MRRVIVFVFAGRRRNMKIQVPLIQRILREHPNVEYHVWNLARTVTDSDHLRTITGDRITVRHDHIGYPWWVAADRIYYHYAQQEYQDCLFVKIDDDVLFMQTERFDEFVDAIQPGYVVSAQVINNGACTRLEPTLWQKFSELDVSLLDVHRSNPFAAMSHDYMFEHWRALIAQSAQVVPCDDWLSINCIGYDWATSREFASRLGKASPDTICGKEFGWTIPIGDEGAVNMGPRRIMQGFVAAHLSFGPQAPSDEQLALWRDNYTRIAQQYLQEAVRENA